MSLLFFEILDPTSPAYRSHESEFPSSVRPWNQDRLDLPANGTHFGLVIRGSASIDCESGRFQLREGMYFSVSGQLSIHGTGCGLLMTRHDQDGLFQIGGPVEATGRLRYIDGCSDTLLIPPVVCGDACLNLLHIPPGTKQTAHTHPTLRAGVILHGTGLCRTPEHSTKLYPGLCFVIPPEAEHSFHTTDSDLLVVAWHPDSDTGPTHDDHPMVNRTIVDGIPASKIPEIRT